MEEKRTIWIVAAAGIFLAVVLLFARMISRSQRTEKNTVAKNNLNSLYTPSGKEDTESEKPSGWVKTNDSGESGAPINTAAKTGDTSASDSPTNARDMTIIAQKATVFALRQDETAFGNEPPNSDESIVKSIDLNKIGGNASALAESNKGGASKTDDAVIKNAENAKNTAEKETSLAIAKTTVKTAPVVKKAAVEKTTPAKASAPAKKTAAPSASPAQNSTTWWVQAASFTSLKYADNARETLGNNKINADVFTYRDAFGKVFYRVRVGPYLTKNEAEYWKGRIGQIESFASAQSFVVRG